MREPLSWDAKQSLIRRRARSLGFRRHELDDAIQEVSLSLLQFNYDAAKSNGASEATVLTTVIDRRLKHLVRGQRRYADLLKRAQQQVCNENGLTDDGMPANAETPCRVCTSEIRSLVERLSPEQKRVCELLMDGQSTGVIAESLGISWRRTQRIVQAIREQFVAAGFESTDAK